MQTYTGLELDLLNPEESQISIEDIAHALSNICRFSGNCKKFYSVAQHSCYVSQYVTEKYKLSALLHDAAETYISDIPTPVKLLFPGIIKMENNILDVIALKFNAPYILSDEVKKADKIMLSYEFRDLMGKANFLSQVLSADISIDPWTPEYSKKRFMEIFEELSLSRSFFRNLGACIL